ncbi:MAG: HlyC/CorC family transporter [Deltaproteobacteria bacterium]|nr:HlyC/CorC family transporter [Deltaproteobacteria bacterium]
MILKLCLAAGIAILVSALCSFVEAVLYSVPVSRVEVLASSGKLSGKLLQRLKYNIQQPITAILTLNTIANTMGAAIAGASAAAVFGDKYLSWFSALFTFIILIFSEILPKTLGVAYNREIAPWIAIPLFALVKILSPIVWIIKHATMLIPGYDKKTEISAEEIRVMAVLSRKSGMIDPQQEGIIKNIIDLKRKTVREVMTPRTVTFTLDKNLSVAEAQCMKDQWNRHSRVPVYDTNPDEIAGIVLLKDVLLSAAEGKEQMTLAALMKPVHFVPETAQLNTILLEFFERRQHLFCVVDEYGGMTGVISLEDIIEEIVGREIIDESDPTKSMREIARDKGKALLSAIKRHSID